MTDKEKIIEAIREIANGKKGLRFPVMSGNVVAGSVDSDAMTCTVQLSVDDDNAPTEGVTLDVVLNNTGGIYGIPSDGSYCIVAEVDGPGKWELLKASAYDEVIVTVGEAVFTMKGGKFSIKNSGGDFRQWMDTFFTHLLALTVPTGTGPSGTPINGTDFTNDKTKFDDLFF